jgi:hypothetical protein
MLKPAPPPTKEGWLGMIGTCSAYTATTRRPAERRVPPRLTGCLALACLLLGSAPVVAQPAARSATAAPASASANQPVGVRLAETPLRIEHLGLSMLLPEQAEARTDQFGTLSTTVIEPAGGIGFFTLQARKSKDAELSPTDVIDALVGRKEHERVLDRAANLTIGRMPADRVYLAMTPSSPGGPTPIRGVTVVRTAPGQVVVIELFTEAPKFDQARLVYETSVATMRVASADDLATRRVAAVRAGVELFERTSADEMASLVASFGQRFERLFTPAVTGADSDATEHGYRRVKAWVGKRGDLTPGRAPSTYSKPDQQDGYIVQIDALLLESDMRVDTQAICFLSLDRSEEAWTIRMAVRDGTQTSRWTETGARRGTSMAVTTQPERGEPQVIKPLLQTEGYLSMVESHLLGSLLARAGIESTFGFYAYQSSAGTVKLRMDSVEKTTLGGPIRVLSRLSDDAESQVATYTAGGEMLRIEQTDGRVWEPVSLEELVSLWKSKGLPLD